MTECSARLIYFLTQAAVVCTEVLFTHSARGQSTHFSCVPEGPAASLTGFRLYRLYPGSPGQRAQATLLSVGGEGEGSGGPSLDPRYRGRLVVASGGLGASWVNLTLSDLQPGDTGLYATELTSGTAASDSLERSHPTCPQVLLLVDGTGHAERPRQLCSSKYTVLLYSIFTATVLLFLSLLLMATWLARARWARAGRPHKPQPPVVIYEEMNSKSERRGAAKPQNDTPSPSHLAEETTAFPVYANPGVRQAEDNYYACPRQVTRPLLP